MTIPSSWRNFDFHDWKTVLKKTLKEFGEDQLALLAASITLRLVLALVPSLIAAVAIAAQFVDAEEINALAARIQAFVPGEQTSDFIESRLADAIDALANGQVGVLGVAVGLFAATGAAATLVAGLNAAWDVGPRQGLVKPRLYALGLVVALGLVLGIMIVALVLAPAFLSEVLPRDVAGSPLLRAAITIGRYASVVAILVLFFSFTFWFGPNRERPQFRLVSPGAVLGVAGWLLLSYLFSLYVRFAAVGSTYGAAAGVFVLLLWLHYSFQVLLVAAELDSNIEKYTGVTGDRQAYFGELLPAATAQTEDAPAPAPAPQRATTLFASFGVLLGLGVVARLAGRFLGDDG